MSRLGASLGLVAIVCVACTDTATAPLTEPSMPDLALDNTPNPVVATVTGGAHWIISSGPFAGLLRRFTFNAVQRADGSAFGEWQLIVGLTILHGDITCLAIEGDGARVGGIVEDGKFTTFVDGTDIAWEAVDGGEGANEAAEDQTSNPVAFRNAPAGSAAEFCASGTVPELPGNPDFTIDAITYGNVQIRGGD